MLKKYKRADEGSSRINEVDDEDDSSDEEGLGDARPPTGQMHRTKISEEVDSDSDGGPPPLVELPVQPVEPPSDSDDDGPPPLVDLPPGAPR